MKHDYPVKSLIGRSVKFVVVIIILLAIVAGGRFLIVKKQRALAQAPLYHVPATLVDTAAVYVGDLAEGHDYLAMVEPVQSATITARVTSTVERVLVDEGDVLTRGQSLIALDHRQTDAQLDAVKAQIKQAQADLEGNRSTVTALEESFAYWTHQAERDINLADKGTISPSTAEATVEKKSDAEGKLSAARQKSASIGQQIQAHEARLAELETTLSYCDIESPFTGVVTSRLVDPGDQASPGKVLIIIQSLGEMMIAFYVPQNDLHSIKPGLPVAFEAGGETREATITRLYPTLNRARMVRAEVMLDGTQAADLTAGQYLTASVAFQQHTGVPLIPVSALIEGGDSGGTHVFVVKDGELEARQIRVVGTACAQAAVEGLEPGEQVVLYSFLGWTRLANGMKVALHR